MHSGDYSLGVVLLIFVEYVMDLSVVDVMSVRG